MQTFLSQHSSHSYSISSVRPPSKGRKRTGQKFIPDTTHHTGLMHMLGADMAFSHDTQENESEPDQNSLLRLILKRTRRSAVMKKKVAEEEDLLSGRW